jgi:transglutaminase-like putative cysteine protease
MFIMLDVAFRRSSFRDIHEAVRRKAESFGVDPPSTRQQKTVDRTLRAVQRATRYYYRSRKDCLPKSLTLYSLLRSQRVPAHLVIAVRRYPFGAHAWVEYRGAPVGELTPQQGGFHVLVRA